MMAPNSPEFAKFIGDDAAKRPEVTATLGVKVRLKRTGDRGIMQPNTPTGCSAQCLQRQASALAGTGLCARRDCA